MSTINIKQPEGGLLQSKKWANMLRAEKKKILTIVSDKKYNIYCVVHKLPIVGKYMYIPRMCNVSEEVIGRLLHEAKNNSLGWLRVDVCDKKLLDAFGASGVMCMRAPHDMQPRENLIIDITLSEEELLAQMKGKTRYNIRLAEKKDVKIFYTRKKEYIDIFCDLVETTANRKSVTFHSREHYQKMFDNIPSDMMQLYVAQYNDKIIAVNIISFYGGVATYLHGATSDEHRNVMAPFLLQWQAIRDAKEKECQWYDFGGVFSGSDDEGKKGVTRFKLGFSPKTETFKTLGSYDVILSQTRYKVYQLLQKIK